MQMPPVDRSPNWRPPQGADLPPASAARAPDAPDPAETGDRRAPGTTANTSAIGTTVQAPDKTVAPDLPSHDWTTVKKKDPPEPPKEPIYIQLLELIRSMWRASGSAVEMAQAINKTTLQERLAAQARNDEPLTYAAPKVKRIDEM
ncbi:hypothetical protein D5045_12575 [Verminephrobacter eiseniae]|uniref:hypothetical protein n=1 Tax=Verminephrobacter eiseniae TaxID=364317 RepID=UPI002238D238|nr:hypothetical protein [Verminephrobacter eiseniae]MCW5260985.1 hypothetical protein [Verminephrobacter eiseniae]